MKFREFLKAWLPVVLWMGADVFRLDRPDVVGKHLALSDAFPALAEAGYFAGDDRAEIHLFVRKAAHVTEYAILTGLFFRALRWSLGGFWGRAAVALVPALIFAPADEFHQSFMRSRTSSPVDVLIDYAGAVLGILICRLIHLVLTRRSGEKAERVAMELPPAP